MANLKYITKLGNQLSCKMSDGSVILAYPVGGNLWYAAGSGGPNPGTGDFIQPFSWDTVSSEYGPRDVTRFHEGIDFGGGAVGGVGTPIHVAGDGVVDTVQYHANFGNMIIVDHGILPGGFYAGKRVKTLYAHMVDPSPLSVGQSVTAGVTVVGGVGNTGASFGAHLHWEVHIMEDGSNIVWNTNNNDGFRTAVDPRTFIGEYGV